MKFRKEAGGIQALIWGYANGMCTVKGCLRGMIFPSNIWSDIYYIRKVMICKKYQRSTGGYLLENYRRKFAYLM